MSLEPLLNGTYGSASHGFRYRVIPRGTTNLDVAVSSEELQLARVEVTPRRDHGLSVLAQRYPIISLDVAKGEKRHESVTEGRVLRYKFPLPSDLQLTLLARCFTKLKEADVRGVKLEDLAEHYKARNMIDVYRGSVELNARLPVTIHVDYKDDMMKYRVVSRYGETVMRGIASETNQFNDILSQVLVECDIEDIELTGKMPSRTELILNGIFHRHYKKRSKVTAASIIDGLKKQNLHKVNF
ncbi:MAG: hypothetical protein ACE5FT_04350 [Candidatus Nanoarchaeia archaeon]